MSFIARLWQSFGFGVQSRTDYYYLHHVIREPLPYYAYDDLQQQFPDASQQDLRKARLLFRICNHAQPKNIRLMGDATPLDRAHLQAACPHAAFTTKPDATYDLLFVAGKAHIAALPHSATIVMQHIDNENSDAWQRMTAAHCITFDMQNIGIAIFAKDRFPEHYSIKKP